jgi:A/G-specific adenine glycosylase
MGFATVPRARPASLAGAAIRWYDATARDLPWRRPDTSPWGVLVSEVMLQQTPVPRVVPVWTAWLARWPTPRSLAAAAAGDAVRAWGRLGYPRRALRLHETASALVDRYGGEVPADVDALLGLPGIGAYTARAVAAFAFGQRHPVVDTNVRRLVARAVGGRAGGGPATTAADLVAVAALLPDRPARAARASVAFMELGALVCTAGEPACDVCPLRRNCRWHMAGRPAVEAPRRRTQRYAGTDRQVRGLLLAVARDAPGPVSIRALDVVWPDREQRQRALTGLLTDGLLVRTGAGHYALP